MAVKDKIAYRRRSAVLLKYWKNDEKSVFPQITKEITKFMTIFMRRNTRSTNSNIINIVINMHLWLLLFIKCMINVAYAK